MSNGVPLISFPIPRFCSARPSRVEVVREAARGDQGRREWSLVNEYQAILGYKY